jgi:hypothetical protein
MNNVNNVVVANKELYVDLPGLLQAFAVISDKTKSFQAVKNGLATIRSVSDFLTTASQNPYIKGSLPNADVIATKVTYLVKGISDIVCIRSKGLADVSVSGTDVMVQAGADEKRARMRSALNSLKINYLALESLMDLNIDLLNPINQALDDLQKVIHALCKKEVVVDATEELLYESSENKYSEHAQKFYLNEAEKLQGGRIDAEIEGRFSNSRFELRGRETFYVDGEKATSKQIRSNIVTESQKFTKPEEMALGEFERLKQLLEKVETNREILRKVHLAVGAFPGFGITPCEDE